MSELASLFKLLDDDDEQLVFQALSALLAHGDDELAPFIAEAQDNPAPQMRKHLHQLQSILALRRRRRAFAARLADPDTPLVDGLIEVHMQWFDNDNRADIEDEYREFLEEAAGFSPGTPETLAYYMRRSDFATPPLDDIIFPEHFTLGPVLETGRGSDALLCAVAKALAHEHGLELKIAHLTGDFVLAAPDGRFLSPASGWKIETGVRADGCSFFTNSRLLRYAMQCLFTYAVESDSFRYIHTLSCALTGLPAEQSLDFLPYPFRGK